MQAVAIGCFITTVSSTEALPDHAVSRARYNDDHLKTTGGDAARLLQFEKDTGRTRNMPGIQEGSLDTLGYLQGQVVTGPATDISRLFNASRVVYRGSISASRLPLWRWPCVVGNAPLPPVSRRNPASPAGPTLPKPQGYYFPAETSLYQQRYAATMVEVGMCQ